MLPVENVRLTSIVGGGFSEDWDDAAGTDTIKWSGDLGAYVQDRVLAQTVGNALSEAKQTTLTLNAIPNVDIVTGDTITYTQYGNPVTKVARDVEDHRVIGILRVHVRDQ